MNVKIRLYWQHDLDLIALSMHPDFDMAHWMKRAVIAYARGDSGFIIPLPRPQPYRVELDSCDVNFALSHTCEEDVIIAMLGFRYGFRNSAVKIVFRTFMERPNLEVFFNEQMFLTKVRGRKRETHSFSELATLAKNTPVIPINRTLWGQTENKSSENEPINSSNLHLEKESQIIAPTSNMKTDIKSKNSADDKIQHIEQKNREAAEKSKENVCDKEKVASNPSIAIFNNELDLTKEQAEDMQGTVFDLFGAVRKLM